MTDEILIRRCHTSDVARITSTEPVGKGYAIATFAGQEAGRCVYLVAWRADDPVGSAELEWGAVPEVKNLHVRAEQRGRGIGTALLLEAERQARKRSSNVALGVDIENRDARRLYERHGYRPDGRRETYTYEYVDDAGVRRSATETSVYLMKELT